MQPVRRHRPGDRLAAKCELHFQSRAKRSARGLYRHHDANRSRCRGSPAVRNRLGGVCRYQPLFRHGHRHLCRRVRGNDRLRPGLAPMCWSADRTATSPCSRCRWAGQVGTQYRGRHRLAGASSRALSFSTPVIGRHGSALLERGRAARVRPKVAPLDQPRRLLKRWWPRPAPEPTRVCAGGGYGTER